MGLPQFGMSKKEENSAYRVELAKRMRRLRLAKGYTYAAMAELLGVSKDAYKKQEKRGALPNYLVNRFAALVGEKPNYVVTGQQEKDQGSPRASPQNRQPNRVG